MFASGGNELTSRCFLREQRREERRREKGRSALFWFSITGALSNMGGEGNYRNTGIQKYINGEIPRIKRGKYRG